MSEEDIVREPVYVDERIDTILPESEGLADLKEFKEHLDELYDKHMQRHWESLKVGLVNKGDRSEGICFELYGRRLESDEEMRARVKRQEEEKQFIDQQKWEKFQELKRYFEKEKKKNKQKQ